MGQKYEVHIDGKPFIIGERPDLRIVPAGWLVLHTEHPGDLAELLRRALPRPEVKGVMAFGDEPAKLWDWFREPYHFVQAAGGAVTGPRGRLLAIRRLGKWDLPKGKVEPNEPIEIAALREVREECGLEEVRVERPLCSTWHTYVREDMPHLKRTDWFLMTAGEGQKLVPQVEEDIDSARWLDAAGVADMRRDTYPSILKVINAWEEALGGGTGRVAPASPWP